MELLRVSVIIESVSPSSKSIVYQFYFNLLSIQLTMRIEVRVTIIDTAPHLKYVAYFIICLYIGQKSKERMLDAFILTEQRVRDECVIDNLIFGVS